MGLVCCGTKILGLSFLIRSTAFTQSSVSLQKGNCILCKYYVQDYSFLIHERFQKFVDFFLLNMKNIGIMYLAAVPLTAYRLGKAL